MQTNRKLLIVLSALFASTLGCSEGEDDGRTSGFSAGESSPPSITTAPATTLLPTTGGGEGDTTALPTTGGLDSDGCLPDPSAGVRCGSTSDSTSGGETDSTASGGETEGGMGESWEACRKPGETVRIIFTVPFLEILEDGEGAGKPEITWHLWAQRGTWGPGNSPSCTFHQQAPYYETSGPSQVVLQKSCKFDILLDPNQDWHGLSTDIGFWAEEYGGFGDDTKKVEGVARVGFDWNMMQWTTQALGGQGSYWIDAVNENFKVRMHFYWAVECVKP